MIPVTGKTRLLVSGYMGFQRTAQPLVAGRSGWVGSRNARLVALAWPGGWAAQGTLQVRPCKLVGAIHGACAPAQPTRPASDTSRRFRPPRKEKRRARARAEAALRPAVGLDQPPTPRRSDRFHPRMAWIYCRHRETVEGGEVSDGGVSAAWMPRPSPQGWVYGVPAIRHLPASPRRNPEPLRLRLWLWLWPLQVQGAALPNTPATLAGHGPALPVKKKPPFGGFLITSA